MKKKTYYFLNPETHTLCREYHTSTPRDAALKAVSTGLCSRIIIAQFGKVHIYSGARVPLADEKHNDFTIRNNITTRPHVQKLTSADIDVDIDPRTTSGIRQIMATLHMHDF